MWRRNAFVAAFAWTLISTSVFAQQPPRAESLFASSEWARFDVVFGKLTALDSLYTKRRSITRKGSTPECGESLCVRPSQGDCKIHYERVDSDGRLIVDIVNADQINIVLQPSAEGAEQMAFTQSCEGLVLELGADGGRDEYRGATIWHLLMAHPEVCRRHLLPTLEVLRPNWRLSEQAERIEQRLVERSDDGIDREEMKRLVDQLGHDRYQRRQEADRILRGMGLKGVSYFDSLRPHELDAEQRMRIRRIRRSMKFNTPDSVDRVANWLMEDRAVWVHMLAHQDPSTRRAATQRLGQICGEEIDFDPTAAPAERKTQVARLQTRLLKR